MKVLQKVIFVLVTTSLILACDIAAGPTAAPTTDMQGVATIVAATIQAITAAAPPAQPSSTALPPAQPTATQAAPTQTSQPAGIPISFQNVSFVIPQGLASGASSQAIPNNPDDTNGGPWAVAPAHVEFTFNGYSLPAGSFSTIQIDIYPAQDYAAMYDGAKMSLQRLQTILSNPSTPLTNDNLPQVPYFNAASMFAAQAKPIQFKNGSGVRMVTQYGQAVGPITNNGTFYHFEGLTSDGKYYIVAVLPVQVPFLANGNDPNAPVPPGGIPFPGYNYNDPIYFDNYFKAVTDKMNATSNGTFSPTLDMLDTLIQSFSIQ